MKGRAKLLVPLFAVLVTVGATALPSFAAPEKIFRVDITPTSVAPGNATFQVAYRNVTPGNSSINSLRLTVPSAFTITGAVSVTGTNPNASKSVAVAGQVVSVTGLDPLKTGQHVTLSVPTSVADPGGCGTSVTWPDSAFEAWTGSSLSGQTFRLAQKSGTTTAVTGNCSLAFNPAPANAGVGENISVPVEVRSGASVVTSFTGDITLVTTAQPTGSTLSGTGTVAASSGVASFTLNGDTLGSYTVRASSSGLTSITASFTLFAGEINCGETPEADPELTRGGFNKDGSECLLVDYTYARTGTGDDDVDNDLVNLQWDTTSQPAAAFEYTIPWDPEAVSPSTGLPTRVTEVSWETDTGGNPVFVPGRACWSNELPSPRGTLNGPVTADATSLDVSGASGLPSTPFAIVIDEERLQVTNVSGSTWTVVRGDGGTAAAAHADGASVMSTPLPLDGSGLVVPICIAGEGWESAGQNLVRYTTRVFDIGDGSVRRR